MDSVVASTLKNVSTTIFWDNVAKLELKNNNKKILLILKVLFKTWLKLAYIRIPTQI
jgi:hypothetical protein